MTLEEQIEAGGVVELGAGVHELSRTIVLKKPTLLTGLHRELTSIVAPANVTAIVAELGAQRSEIRNLSIEGVGSAKASTATFGIDQHVALHVERINVRGFVQGVRITASARSSGTNANRWRLSDVLIQHCMHAGLFIDGPDVNAGVALNVDVLSTCMQASRWKAELGQPAGIVDSSFLGNTFLGSMVDGSYEKGADTYPAFFFFGDSQHSILIGCYEERSSLPGVMARHTTVLGGIGAWTGDGFRLSGPDANALSIHNTKDPKNVVTVSFGDRAAASTFMQWEADELDASRPLRFKSDAKLRRYVADLANQVIVDEWPSAKKGTA